MTRYRSLLPFALGFALFYCQRSFAGSPEATPKLPVDEKNKPRVEVVFCLDTTGSMSGLIDGAKRKIWSIANQIAGGTPTPEVRIGLVGYRDKGDAYVTKVHPITSDLDEVFKNLSAFKADGGGDTPESVNQALHEAIEKIEWSSGDATLRLVFLVGDCPPHMDYQDDVKYPETCKKTNAKNIRINTILCGSNEAAAKIWREIAVLTDSSFAQIEQQGGVVAVPTPYDKELAELNVKLMKTNLCWGDAAAQKEGVTKNSAVANLESAGGAAADNVAYRSKVARFAANDLLDDLAEGKLKLDALTKEQLPKELADMTPEAQVKRVEELKTERAALKTKTLELDKARLEFLAKNAADNKDKSADGFDNQLLEMLRKQAEQAKIKY